MNLDAVIVGLGNPGKAYLFTRHNIGFICLDVLAQDQRSSFTAPTKGLAKTCNAESAEISWDSKKCLLLKPQTFMNLSGESLRALYLEHPHLRQKPLIVVHDEVDIAFGKIRVKLGGGDAGHNGLRSLRECLGHGDYYRVRLGVGKPENSNEDLRDYVLGKFTKSDQPQLHNITQRAIQIIHTLLEGDLLKAQSQASLEDISPKT